jgi:nucleoside-triphosphatase THEP1
MEHIVITGPTNSGKTTLLYTLCSRLDSAGYSVGGIAQVMPLPHAEKNDWVISDQGSGEVRTLLSQTAHEHWERFGRFWYDQTVFDWASACLLAHRETHQYITIDEIGPIELQGKGLDAACHSVFSTYSGTVISVIRSSLLEAVLERYGLDRKRIKLLDTRTDYQTQLTQVLNDE